SRAVARPLPPADATGRAGGRHTGMNVRAALGRASSMDAREMRFRVAQAARRHAGRVRFAVSAPSWNRRHFAPLLNRSSAPLVAAAHDAAASGSFLDAHYALAAHLLGRESRWPLKAARRERLAGQIR